VNPPVKHLSPGQRDLKGRQLAGRGSALLRQGRAAQAIPLLERAHSLLPEDVPIAVNLGGALAMNGRYEQAIAILEQACQREPDSAMVWVNLGAAYLGDLTMSSDEQQQRAIAAFERALEIEPTAPNVHYSLGLIHRHRNEIDEARRLFHQAVQTNPLDSHARRAWERLQDEGKEKGQSVQRPTD
jgi:tetratricopeptide (TPR) repeat protein